jgi:hypothetical protein
MLEPGRVADFPEQRQGMPPFGRSVGGLGARWGGEEIVSGDAERRRGKHDGAASQDISTGDFHAVAPGARGVGRRFVAIMTLLRFGASMSRSQVKTAGKSRPFSRTLASLNFI